MAHRRFTEADLHEACNDLATLPFPPGSWSAVMFNLSRMCPHYEALRYVVDTALARCTRWPGLAELRGILCNRYTPADKIDGWCSIPGLTAEDGELRHLVRHEEIKQLPCQPNEFTKEIVRIAARKAF